MIFGITTFTLIHVVLSLIGIVAGLVVAGGLAAGKRLDRLAGVFWVTTVATNVTGFGFPFTTFLPSHAVAVVSLVVLALVLVAHVKRLAGAWRRIYVIGVVLATYLNVFVLVTQLFRRLPALIVAAPTQSEPPFAITQVLVLALFVWLAVAAHKGFRAVVLAFVAATFLPRPATAQTDTAVVRALMQRGAQLDREGATAQARVIFQGLIDSAADPAAKAAGQRAMAMSYAFDGDCANTMKYEEPVVAFWATREATDPQNAFFQEGEVANETARACIDAGDLDAAERWYRRGYAAGVKEPAPATHPRSLWEYRLAHALGRIAARRGNKEEAERQIAAARRILDADTALAAQQERFFPYLVGYVALYTGDLATAEAQLAKAVALRGNERDPFMHCLLAMTLERLNRQEEAKAMYQKAYQLATGHNPPAAYVRPLVRRKLGLR